MSTVMFAKHGFELAAPSDSNTNRKRYSTVSRAVDKSLRLDDTCSKPSGLLGELEPIRAKAVGCNAPSVQKVQRLFNSLPIQYTLDRRVLKTKKKSPWELASGLLAQERGRKQINFAELENAISN